MNGASPNPFCTACGRTPESGSAEKGVLARCPFRLCLECLNALEHVRALTGRTWTSVVVWIKAEQGQSRLTAPAFLSNVQPADAPDGAMPPVRPSDPDVHYRHPLLPQGPGGRLVPQVDQADPERD